MVYHVIRYAENPLGSPYNYTSCRRTCHCAPWRGLNSKFKMESKCGTLVTCGVATIEATEAAASVKILNNRLSRPEFFFCFCFFPDFLLKLLDRITVSCTHGRIYSCSTKQDQSLQ